MLGFKQQRSNPSNLPSIKVGGMPFLAFYAALVANFAGMIENGVLKFPSL